MNYVEAIRLAIHDSMLEFPEMTILGQGVWSPFYVGKSMDGIEAEFGRTRVIDTPVSENAITGIALGSALSGHKTLVIHPRMDFMILAMDPIINAAAKWRYSLNWQGEIPLTIRSIVNRGGEQGAQHSQSLQSWFAHVPGLRVVMPSSAEDAYYLLRQSMRCPDPVLFIEDRWSYERKSTFIPLLDFQPLSLEAPKIVNVGNDVTIVGIGHATNLCLDSLTSLIDKGISVDVIDLRVLQPLDISEITKSVVKTGRLVVVDGAWRTCGMASEIVARVVEEIDIKLKSKPIRITLPDSPAPTSSVLENAYYPTSKDIISVVAKMCLS